MPAPRLLADEASMLALILAYVAGALVFAWIVARAPEWTGEE